MKNKEMTFEKSRIKTSSMTNEKAVSMRNSIKCKNSVYGNTSRKSEKVDDPLDGAIQEYIFIKSMKKVLKNNKSNKSENNIKVKWDDNIEDLFLDCKSNIKHRLPGVILH